MVDTLPRLRIIAQLMVDYLSQQEIADILNEIIEQKETEVDEEETDTEGTFDSISTSGGGMSGPKPMGNEKGPDLDSGLGEPNMPDLDNSESDVSAGSSDEIDLSSIEGEDLL